MSLSACVACFFDPRCAPLSARPLLTLAASGPTLLPLVESVPASALGAGRYTLYALIAPAGTPASQVVEKKQGNLMTVTVAIQP